jgi:phosphoserine aminotransferase
MISFYPGPSKVYPRVPEYVQDAYRDGILSINHRSREFVNISSMVIRLLKEKLSIPEDYTIFFTSSATECWEIISQSLVNSKSLHIYNGAFGEKWYNYAQKLQPEALSYTFGMDELLQPATITIPRDTELIAVTHNETSNGTAVDQQIIGTLAQQYPKQLLAVDATSSMAGAALDFQLADIWYASVQKCFGLPAGLALLICSPKALQRAAKIGERNHYNSVLYLKDMMDKYQTTYTPNVLNIYLLMRVMEECPSIYDTQQLLSRRYDVWLNVLQAVPRIDLLVKNEAVRSLTVIPFTAQQAVIDQIRDGAKVAGIVLGNGYGIWKASSLRIANFPAHEDLEINRLQDFFFSLAL